MAAEVVESVRFVTGTSIVRDLCILEGDLALTKRMIYTSALRLAYNKLNFKTQMFTKRVALPVIRDTVPYVLTPPEYLDLSSVSAENECGKLEPMIINTNIKMGIADITLLNKCGCGKCGCENDVCSSVRNFEDIEGTMDAIMPDGSTRTFKTLYRKVILMDGSYVEQKTLPMPVYVNGVHTDTKLEMQETFICKLEIKECGCLKDTAFNKESIVSACQAVNYKVECGCAITDLAEHQAEHNSYNVEEDGSRIYLPSNFRHDYVVIRFYANSKTKDIIVPYLATEALMATIKEITTNFDPKIPKVEKQWWKNEAKQKKDELKENLSPVNLAAFYAKQFGVHNQR